ADPARDPGEQGTRHPGRRRGGPPHRPLGDARRPAQEAHPPRTPRPRRVPREPEGRTQEGRPVMSVLITDPVWAQQLRAEREKCDGDKWSEVWDGVHVLPTLPDDEHQEIQGRLLLPLILLIGAPGLGKVRPGVNVTDRHPDWMENYRGP